MKLKFSRKSVVNKIRNTISSEGEISVEEAQERYGPNYGDGDVIEEEVTPKILCRNSASQLDRWLFKRLKRLKEILFTKNF